MNTLYNQVVKEIQDGRLVERLVGPYECLGSVFHFVTGQQLVRYRRYGAPDAREWVTTPHDFGARFVPAQPPEPAAEGDPPAEKMVPHPARPGKGY